MTTFIPNLDGEPLREAILDCIRAGFQRTAQISERLNQSSRRISTRLNYMQSLGLIHGVRAIDEVKGGSVNIWCLGPALNKYGQPAHVPIARGCITRRRVILASTYPLVDRRDPLVTALFGAPVVERRAASPAGAA
jgi:hypothetical protein